MTKKTFLLLPIFFLFSGCSWEWLQSNTTKAILDEIWRVVFKAAIQSLSSDSKVDFGHAMAKGMWEQGSVAIDSGAVKRLANAWSADHLPKLAVAASTAYQIAKPLNSKQKAQVADTIAAAITEAALVNGCVAVPK